MLKHSFRHSLVAVLVLVSMLSQGTWVLAGTTGALSGNVFEGTGTSTPIVGAKVAVTSPSQASTSISDANGHFVFLSLAPDSYTVSVEKAGYEPVSVSGVTVQADQNQSVQLNMKRSLQTIGRVTSRASSAIVRPGTTSDVYSVNQSAATAVQSFGGGGNIDNYYSAVASVPGVTLGYGGVGWGQTLYIHGSNYAQVGYELDGIPVNRAFDNYQATTASNLGQQELQVVTSSVAGASSSSVAGYINQVIRTGTYPGFATYTTSVGSPTFYHQAKFEIGGATPNRNFSYYIGLSGYNQDYRYGDQFQGGSYPPTQMPGFPLLAFQQGSFAGFGGVFPNCVNGVSPYTLKPGQPGFIAPGTGGANGCIPFGIPYNYGTTTSVYDREAVVNLHIGIPHHNDAGKDDIQILYNGSALLTKFADSVNDLGGLTQANQILGNLPAVTGHPTAPIIYGDAYTFPQNTPFLAPASTLSKVPYLFPSSGSHAFGGAMDPNLRDGQNNDAEILKLQYQKNISPTSYVRAYGYTFYSDWFLNGPVFTGLQASMVPTGQGYGADVEPAPPDYELDTHTRGGEISYANQFNSKNLLSASVGYVTANVLRLNNGTPNNSWAAGPGAGIGIHATSLTDGTNCYDSLTGTLDSCYHSSTAGTIGQPIPLCGSSSSCTPGQPIPITGAALAAGATYRETYNGFNGTLNTVMPQFSSASLTDAFKPNDRLLLNAGLRYENYNYVIPSTSNGPDYAFWFNQAAQSYCFDPATNAPVTVGGVHLFGAPPLVVTAPGAPCPNSPISGKPTLHPNGQNGAPLYTNKVAGTFNRAVLMPRLNGTYTFNPDTVLRFGGGVYSEPYNTATTEYLNLSAKSAATFDYQTFWPFGFNTPQHEYDPSKSYNFDASYERHFKGTDESLKITPFYRYVHNQYQDFFIGAGFVSSIPTGDETAYGAEVQLTKGDPSRNGLSGTLSYTYTNAFMKFHYLANGSTPVTGLNAAIDAYNALTGQGNVFGVKGAPCYVSPGPFSAAGNVFNTPTSPGGIYTPSSGSAIQVCTAGGGPNGQPQLTAAGAKYVTAGGGQVIVNPYYNLPAQGDANLVGPYPVYQTFPSQTGDAGFPDTNGTIVWPHVIAAFATYKHDRISLTPNLQAISGYSGGSAGGANYGSPLAITGVDPRTCWANQTNVPTAPNKGLANYNACFFSEGSSFGTLYVPNPYTGKFDSPGQYHAPWFLNLNMNVSYELSSKVKATLVLSNLYNTCFGGSSTPWSSAFSPGYWACGYVPNDIYTSNFYNGKSPNDVAANGVLPRPQQLYPYQPVTTFLPFQAALQFQFQI